MSKKSNNNCEPGEIERKGYRRKGYQRNEYVRKNGTVVPASYVSAANVPSTCINDLGKPGKGPKTLPKPGDKVHLTQYGYSIHKPTNLRRAALRAATKDYNTLVVLRRLNLLRNYQAIPENKEIFTDDVEYMKKLYSNIRRTKPKSGSKQHGGIPYEQNNIQDPMTSDIDSPNERMIEVNTFMNMETICTDKSKCSTKSIIKESHTVNGKQVMYYTLEEKDAEQVLELDQMFLDSDLDKNAVVQKIINKSGLLIGIKVNDKLEGYCQYEPVNNTSVKIIWFCANKGFGTPLYTFMEKFFKMNDNVKITLVVSLEGTYSTKRLNFWYAMGFRTYETLSTEKKVCMEKNI